MKKEIYTRLPRFIEKTENIEYVKGKYLDPVRKNFKFVGKDFTLIIFPVTVSKKGGNGKHFFPGHREKLIEEALRSLARIDNISFRNEDSTLVFSVNQISNSISNTSKNLKVSNSDIELGIEILTGSNYRLTDGYAELNIRPIQEMEIIRRNEDTYYKAKFSDFFFGQTQLFDKCFPLHRISH